MGVETGQRSRTNLEATYLVGVAFSYTPQAPALSLPPPSSPSPLALARARLAIDDDAVVPTTIELQI